MHLRFDDQHVQQIPQESGIFCLWNHALLVYIGRTAPRSNLRAELQHALTIAMAEDMCATHFTFEVTPSPKTRAAEELRDFLERWGSLPRYNQARRAHVEGAVPRAGRAA